MLYKTKKKYLSLRSEGGDCEAATQITDTEFFIDLETN